MGRYVLGILAVVAMQIAFSIYMSYNTPDHPTVASANVNVGDGRTAPMKRRILAKSEPPFVVKKGVETESAKAANAADSVPVDSSSYARSFPTRAESTVARPAAIAVPRRAIFRPRTPVDRASVERQYFGRMVVERTFWPAKQRAIRSTAIVNRQRQTFGRMVVERTSGV